MLGLRPCTLNVENTLSNIPSLQLEDCAASDKMEASMGLVPVGNIASVEIQWVAAVVVVVVADSVGSALGIAEWLGIALESQTSCPSPPVVLSSEGEFGLKKIGLRMLAMVKLFW